MDRQATRGRPRSAAIDEAVLAAVRRQLSEGGYAALSFAAVAEEAGTTRPAIYRRWATKAALAESAMASYPTGEPPVPAANRLGPVRRPRRRARGLPARRQPPRAPLAGRDDAAVDDGPGRRRALPGPRRGARGAPGCERSSSARRREGAIDRDADLDVAVTMLTGSWYARCLAGDARARRLAAPRRRARVARARRRHRVGSARGARTPVALDLAPRRPRRRRVPPARHRRGAGVARLDQPAAVLWVLLLCGGALVLYGIFGRGGVSAKLVTAGALPASSATALDADRAGARDRRSWCSVSRDAKRGPAAP